MATEAYPRCALCPVKLCENRGAPAGGEPPSLEGAPPFCAMKLMPEVFEAAAAVYENPETAEFAKQASLQEAACYEKGPDGLRARLPRIEELIQFARKCGYRTLGLAHCTGLAEEARLLTRILEKSGFTVVSVQCKAGGVPKERIGVPAECKIAGPGDWETMCNPVAQALALNKAKVDLAVMLGLCIGHDTLFIKHLERPLTILAVKDRVLGHNPLAALYTSGTYYRRLAGGIE